MPDRNGIDLEELRRSYLPKPGVRFLLLGESPPPVRGFFYTCDSTLYRETRATFTEVLEYPSDCVQFLHQFAADGFYLEDFSVLRGAKPHRSVSGPDTQTGVKKVSQLISEHRPVAILGVLKEIAPLVKAAVAASQFPETPWDCIPFPHHRSSRGKELFVVGLRTYLGRYVSGSNRASPSGTDRPSQRRRSSCHR